MAKISQSNSVPSSQQSLSSDQGQAQGNSKPHKGNDGEEDNAPNLISEKTRNAAERFSLEHHGEYEARGKQSKHRINRVHQHNAAYPKMYDELDKRRWMMNPKAVNRNRQNYKGKVQRRQNRSYYTRARPNTRSGITKRSQKLKKRNQPAYRRAYRHSICNCCHCAACRIKMAKCQKNNQIPVTLRSENDLDKAASKLKHPNGSDTPYPDQGYSKYPDNSSNASVSGYPSVATFDDEPMVE